jgi:hypothetical protein
MKPGTRMKQEIGDGRAKMDGVERVDAGVADEGLVEPREEGGDEEECEKEIERCDTPQLPPGGGCPVPLRGP